MNKPISRPTRLTACLLLFCLLPLGPILARDYHVSPNGDDSHDGSASSMLKTISAAAARAEAGDVITVHAGVYRERINPPRGGDAEDRRILYRAAPGDRVVIKGSEVVTGWTHVAHDTWRVTLPDTLFGDFNPYLDLIHGDWFNPKGREHHTGAVYLDGHWLVEAATKEDVLKPYGETSSNYVPNSSPVLLNVAWLQVGDDDTESARVPAAGFSAHRGIKTAASEEGGECIGWIESGDWVRYDGVDFGQGAGRIRARVASATAGGIIEVRLNEPNGKLLGRLSVPHTGGWQSWVSKDLRLDSLSGTQTLCLVFRSPNTTQDASPPTLWFAEVEDRSTTLWAQFPDTDPNTGNVEINVRQTVFYPDQPGRNYITVRGFVLEHAATPWAPPTAEQIGLIGTHWSKGWIIENNTIRYSTCTGVTLGKHGDEFDNTSEDTAVGYVDTIKRGLARGWSKENIGHHVVRNNHIAFCEQAGIVGSLGPIFCTVTGNEIHDIHVRQLFTGAEMAGIKFHAAIDTVISHNHIYRTGRGIWLDWMTQGTHVTGNLVHDTAPREDLFVEVNHGPFLIDHNLFLSEIALLDVSEGGAYAHNLFAGRMITHPELRRDTPWQEEHGTAIAGMLNTQGGDNRFLNNLLVGPAGLDVFDSTTRPNDLAGNVYVRGANPSAKETKPVVAPDFDPTIRLREEADGWRLTIDRSRGDDEDRGLITSARLGRAAVTGQGYVRPDGAPHRLDHDYLGRTRNKENPAPGPFAGPGGGIETFTVWPKSGPAKPSD